MTEEQINDKWGIHQVIQEAISKAHNTPAPETLKRLDDIQTKMNDNYSKRELDEHFKDVKTQIDAVTKLGTAIDIKVGIQNGRVTKNETWIRGVIMAGSASLFLLGIIGSLIVYSFKLSQDNLRNTILLEIKK